MYVPTALYWQPAKADFSLRTRPILYVTHRPTKPVTQSPQGTALVVAIEPVLCCRLILNTYRTLRPRGDTTGVTAPTEAPTELFTMNIPAVNPHSVGLDSMGWPTLSG